MTPTILSPHTHTYSGLPLIIHLKIPWLFPDFSLTFYSFPYPRKNQKSFLFFTLMVLTVSPQNWGLLLKERICSSKEQILSFKSSPPMKMAMGLDYLMRKYILSPFEQINFLKTAIAIYFQNSLTFPWLSKSFLNFPGHPQNSPTFPDLEKISFSRHFSLTMTTLLISTWWPSTTHIHKQLWIKEVKMTMAELLPLKMVPFTLKNSELSQDELYIYYGHSHLY